MMPPKTIYVPDSAVPTWEEAERLWGDSLASLVNRLVKEYVEEENARLASARVGAERIVIEVGQDERRLSQAFRGRWLLAPEEDETRTAMEGYDRGAYYGVALTEKGNVAVWVGHCNERWAPKLDVFPSLEAALAGGVPADIVAMASEGDFVVELDI